ncbi:MAG: hypothetical protein M3253_08620 [Chloroflexota bacterium]|nr:hypothetical protein [Chloroflexota bacterium]
MLRRTTEPAVADPNWTPAPGEPHDRCFRCGRPTPVGVSLCARDNPGRVKGPSATQVHGTIALGVIGGFVGFILLVGAIKGSAGPFTAAVTGHATQATGALEVVVRVTNEGPRTAAASCRVSRGGVLGANDTVFFTEPIPAGEARDFRRAIPPPAPNAPIRQPGALAVTCS